MSQAIYAALRCKLIDYEPERIDASQKSSITRTSIKRVILTVDGDGMACDDQKNPFNYIVLREPLMIEWDILPVFELDPIVVLAG